MMGGPASVRECNRFLVGRHYLGPTKAAGFGWKDEHGVMLFAAPRSRHLPSDWLELVRWCLTGQKNGGSRQWASFSRWARKHHPATTIVSYSDPGQGHTGALYRACNWSWAPTWLRLQTPPSGNGNWGTDQQQEAKDRWVFQLRDDERRPEVLGLGPHPYLLARMPWAQFPGDYKRFAEARRQREAA